ncbi:LacI family DNA-binding transcriptional regulator [Clostridium oryzae]|uniref:HTH-type transcriptional repressor CytR n=1 Tax=Clostridium oryzae TaxID=1450648 RepID=A0A1V4IYP4_9CLOT|nr:LacI family DNA-binding transcriptional regulator [Clostridium oryzae]OPJ65013.1 HTH-type transcriptional repressor CytR [Clostridium oryzae]
MATMKDVAKAANVSIITVSRVINKPDMVKSATRLLVEETMKKMNFLPNHAAKALAEKATRAIHLYVPEYMPISDPFIINLIAGISEELSKAYYLFLIIRELNYNQLCDGIIVTGLRLREESKIQKQIHVPFVLFGKSEMDIDCIDIDNVAGAEMLMDYIISKGHNKIGFIMINSDQRFAHERFIGYKAALAKHNIKLDEALIRYAEHSEKDGYEKTMDLLSKEEPSAIFCCNDLIALGSFRAAAELGLSIPEDISIAGFDSLSFDLLTKVPLTTVKQPVYEAGRKLAVRLLNRIQNKNLKLEKSLIAPELIIRESISTK